MTDSEFKTHVDALVLRKLEVVKQMSHQFDLFYDEIACREYNFDRGEHPINK